MFADSDRSPRRMPATGFVLTALLTLSACGGGGGGHHASNGGGGPGGDDNNPPTSEIRAGLLETTLGNTGKAADAVVPVGAQATLAGIGKALDPSLEPVVADLVGLTQMVGSQTGLGAPVNGVLQQAGNAVGKLGDTVADSGLPLNLGEGAGGLVSGLGDTVASVGGLLQQDPDNPQPLTRVLANATNAVASLTGALGDEGGLLHPINATIGGVSGGLLGGTGQPILEPALTNVGTAADNVLGLQLASALGGVGAALDPAVSGVAGNVTGLTQMVGGATNLGAPVDNLLTSVGGTVSDLGGNLPGGLGGAVDKLGDTVASVGGLLNAEGNPNPLGAVLNNATGAVSELTSGLGGLTPGGGEGLLSPITGVLGGLGAGDANAGLLAPVTGLLSGVTGGTGNSATGGLLAPVTSLLGGVTGDTGMGSEGGLLAPVTGLLGGITGGGTGADGGGLLAPVTGLVAGLTGDSAQGGGLLAPVTGLLGGGSGGGNPDAQGGLLGGLLGGLTGGLTGKR